MIRSYSELCKLKTFKERFEYLSVKNSVGLETFGHERYLNQKFYTSKEWRRVRNFVIDRDQGCDLGLDGYEIYGQIIIHHMNPIVAKDIIHSSDQLMNPDYLICTSLATHNALHYGEYAEDIVVERKVNDTCPWKK